MGIDKDEMVGPWQLKQCDRIACRYSFFGVIAADGDGNAVIVVAVNKHLGDVQGQQFGR